MDPAIAITSIGLTIFLSYFLSRFFKKTKIPDVLPLFLLGIIIGPLTGWVKLSDLGDLGGVFATLALLVILFESGVDIQLRRLLESFPRTLLLLFLTLFTTIAVVMPLAFYLFNIPLVQGLLMGIILGGVSSLVIPIGKSIGLKQTTRTTLSVEATFNDIITIILVFGIIELIQLNTVNIGRLASEFTLTIFSSLAIGVTAAFLWVRGIKIFRGVKHNIITTPAFLFIVFGAAELLYGNGFMAALVFAVLLGNMKYISKKLTTIPDEVQNFSFTETERKVFSAVSFIFKTFLFVYIGIAINIQNTAFLLWGAGIMLVLLILRAISVNVSLGGHIPRKDLVITSGLLPKGLTGTAILVIIGDRLLQDLSYPIILFSILYTSVFIYIAELYTKRQEKTNDEEPIPPPPYAPAPEKAKHTEEETPETKGGQKTSM